MAFVSTGLSSQVGLCVKWPVLSQEALFLKGFLSQMGFVRSGPLSLRPPGVPLAPSGLVGRPSNILQGALRSSHELPKRISRKLPRASRESSRGNFLESFLETPRIVVTLPGFSLSGPHPPCFVDFVPTFAVARIRLQAQYPGVGLKLEFLRCAPTTARNCSSHQSRSGVVETHSLYPGKEAYLLITGSPNSHCILQDMITSTPNFHCILHYTIRQAGVFIGYITGVLNS